MNLYINCCVRKNSRTDRLAREVLKKLDAPFEELKLETEGLLPLTAETLEKRTRWSGQGDYSDEMFRYAKQFAAAGHIVIGAPYWDMSFPSSLKVYIEHIYVTGIVSRYGENGQPVGLCRAETLTYVTTAGGPYEPAFSYGYIKTLAEQYMGIGEARLVSAEKLDIAGNDAEAILEKAVKELGGRYENSV